ncbi:unnamed protein product [Blepharisma stoltei]|uniref:Uncharacterized protein n=1 Tax=Blepharisma stoltei TaxID=1481888 RepID=A0AAU9JPY3_9CILI|nr:unnamed protein product [Blepharisma stoltei]
MENQYQHFSESESASIHKKLLLEGNIDAKICAKRVLNPDCSSSLPMFYENLIGDKSKEQIFEELLGFYCRIAPMRVKLESMIPLKRKIREDEPASQNRPKRRKGNKNSMEAEKN